MRLIAARPIPARLTDRRGAALLVVLWLAVAATGLALALLEATRRAAPDDRRAVDAIRLRLAVQAAVQATAARLLREEVELGPEGGRLGFEQDGIALRVRVTAESGLVDLASASPGLLRGLAEATGRTAVEARALAEEVERRRSGRGGEATDAPTVGATAATALRPPARPGLDHPAEVAELPGADPEAVRVESVARWLALVTLGTGRSEPLADLAPEPVRAALAGEPRGPSGSLGGPSDGGPAGTAPAGPRRADPANLYRLAIVARTPAGRIAVRSARLLLKPGEDRPVRIVDWSGPELLPDDPFLAEGT